MGNGKATREIIYVDDIANACIYFMNKKTKRYSNQYRNRKRLFNKLLCKIIVKVNCL